MPLLSENTIREWDRVIKWVKANLMRRDQVPQPRPRRGPSDVPRNVTFVRCTDSGDNNRQSVVTVQEVLIVVNDDEGEKVPESEIALNDTVTVTATGDEFFALNPRNNYIYAGNIIYTCYRIKGYWVIDNAQAFWEWTGTEFN